VRDQPGHRGDGRLAPGGEGDGEVDRDRDHVALLVLLAGFPQLGAAAVDLVAGHPGEWHAGAGRAGDHRGAQGGLGGERHLVRDVRPLAPLFVLVPGFRQVQLEIEQRAPAGGE
jgi:hypothetical protein